MRSWLWLSLGLAACTPIDAPPVVATGIDDTLDPDGLPNTYANDGIVFEDIGDVTGVQDYFNGQWQKGRGCAVADFDLDGRDDLLVSNPMDESYILRNVTAKGGPIQFERGQTLAVDDYFWGSFPGDFDNDGDPDVFNAAGGNEKPGFDRMFVNNAANTRAAGAREVFNPLVDQTYSLGVGIAEVGGVRIANRSAGGAWGDVDNDGDLDLFVSEDIVAMNQLGHLSPDEKIALNQLWINHGDHFEDVGIEAGFVYQYGTRNSVWIDFDHDGDLDLYENNTNGPSFFWENQHEPGEDLGRFVDITAQVSLKGDLTYPLEGAWGAAVADLNNDGWEDILVARRSAKQPGEPEEVSEGHIVLLNAFGRGFVDVGDLTGLRDGFLSRDHLGGGVMGTMIDDIDADGYPDVMFGNGSPESGGVDQTYLSSGVVKMTFEGIGTLNVPQWEDVSGLTDYPAPEQEGIPYPAYPYKSHALCSVDLDNDGLPEVFEAEGGPGEFDAPELDATMKEPDRLWKIHLPDPQPHWLKVKLHGDGVRVNRDAIGAYAELVVSEGEDGPTRSLYKWRVGQNGFAQSSEPVLFFGLGTADTIHSLTVHWPDGLDQDVEVPGLDQIIEITH